MSIRTRRWHMLTLALLLLAGITACGNEVEAAPKPTPTATAPVRRRAPTATPQPRPTVRPATPAAGEVAIVLTEQELNAMLASALAGQEDLPLTDAAIRLDPGVIVGTARVKMAFLNAKLEVFVELSAADGKVDPELVKVLLDGKAAPGFIQNQITSQAAPYLAQARAADPGFYVETVTITGDELQITGR